MASKTIEAKLLITAESRVEAEMAKVAKAIQQGLDVTKYTAETAKLSRAWEQQAKAARAAAAVMDARKPLEATVQGMQRVGAQATRLAREYDVAKKAAAEYGKAQTFIKGSEQAEQAARLAAEVRRLGDAHRAAVNDSKALTAAFSAETAALRAAESAASRYGVDLSRVEQQQRTLARSTDQAAAAFRRQVAAEEAGVRAAAARAQRRQAQDVAAGVVATATGAGLRGAYVRSRDGWIEMDEASRRQRAVLGIDQAKQSTLNTQALKIGQDTRFSNPDVVKAQTRIGSSLPDHLKDPKVLVAITENAKDYALAMGTTMDEASSAVLGRMLGLRMNMSNPEAAAASAKHATNRLVQFAKSSGADHNDLMGYTKFGAAPSSVGGFSEEFTDAMAAQLRRIGYEGSMAGNFVRAAATKLAVPTSKGLGVLAGSGLNHSDYVAPGKALSADNLGSALRLKFGKGLNDSQRSRIRELMEDEDIVGNREEFVPKVSAIIQETLARRTKKGAVNAQDAERIAKSVNEYLSASAGAVDIERLMRDVIAKGITPAMAKYLFGQEHGGRAQALDLKTLNKDVETFRNTPQDRAQKIGEDINAGTYGAYQRMIGSVETFWMKLGQVNDGPLTMFYDKVGNAVDAVTNLPPNVIQAGTAIGGLAGAAIAARGAFGMFRVGRDLLGFGGGAAALNGSAVALNAAAAALTEAAVLQGAKGVAGALPDAAKKGGKLAGLARGALGITAIGGLAELAQHYDTLKMPEFTKDGIGRGLLGALDPNLPDMVLGKKADEIGKDTGTKVGKGIAEGVKEKAPEVEAEGKTLFQRLNEQFRQGIFVPIHLAPGEGFGGGGGGGGLIQKASFGGSGSGGPGGIIRKSSIGSAGGGAGVARGGGAAPYVGGGGGISARDMRNIDPEFAAHIRASALSQGIDPDIALRIANSEGLRGSNPNRLTPGDYENGKPTSFGPFQLHYGRSGGLGNRYTAETGHHASDPRYWKEQIDFALRTARKEGWGAWYGRRGAGIGLRDGIGTVKPVPMAKDGEPKLVKGLDGKEGLDLGNGTMKMPDGSIRSITRSGLEIPDAPAGGIGAAGSGRGSIGAHVEEFGRHVDRLQDMGFHGQISLAVTGSGRQQVRATALKMRGRGGMTADMGITLPDLERDWYTPPPRGLTDV
ncbi:phage tail tape measure protein, TP901 family, core region [Methylobacterium sp. 275MFSha3.1]|uniref:phage tail tape measure protein n=1 Tax=Methylobacterium sp. 275MFSha3.1 TaxID=1502746 RepID=UPI0008A7DCD7|nr:phage tail tape measure protein [Methylobacterium sp. 275MFSha3.1]SEI14983.1 phage tail tape measure protein, TP901 family, core region [Methylobacterium sp. 275MFSha3.1]